MFVGEDMPVMWGKWKLQQPEQSKWNQKTFKTVKVNFVFHTAVKNSYVNSVLLGDWNALKCSANVSGCNPSVKEEGAFQHLPL